nr:anaerobic carbon-monoxide dehydrogenase catalytic subunit [Candidatus Njordarchaeota archaeon]
MQYGSETIPEEATTVFDRYSTQVPICGFGELGLCCRNCMQGPCKIDPFGVKPTKGSCGASADTIVARNLVRSIAGGTSAHVDHARHVLEVLEKAAKGLAPYSIKDETKLKAIAIRLGLDPNLPTRELALKLVEAAEKNFTDLREELAWLKLYAPKKRQDVWRKLGVIPTSALREIVESMHRTTMGVDADPVNLILGAIKLGLVDGYAGLQLATDLHDILFGTPQPVVSEANLGVLKEDAVNVAVHGHVPLLSEKIVEWAHKLEGKAKQTGAKSGINVVGICCTGNEVLMRHGVPLATNYLGQEFAIATGAIDLAVVDVQCIMPALADIAQCYHTKVVTTSPIAKIPGAEHVELTDEKADEVAKDILEKAIQNYNRRDKSRVRIPQQKSSMMGGFSAEAIVTALSKVNPKDPLQPLIENIANGNILGVAGVVGCNNVKVPQDTLHIDITKELIANNVLVVGTGCWAIAAAKAGLMTPEATKKYAGKTLAAVLSAVGKAAGLDGPLPPCLHMGSCVDNSRIHQVLVALSDKLGVDISSLPVVASAPEAMSEKALAIGTWAVSLGLLVHLGVIPPVVGSKVVTEVLTSKAEELLGGKVVVEPDPKKAAQLMIDHIKAKRKKLGI